MSSQNSQRLLWFSAGISLGIALGLLYAPRSGKATRRLLSERATTGGKALLESGREIFERGRELYDKGRQIADEAAELFDEGKKLVEGSEVYAYGNNAPADEV